MMKKILLALGLMALPLWADETYSLRGASVWVKEANGICLGAGIRTETPINLPVLNTLGIDFVVVKKDTYYGGIGIGFAPSDMVDISVGITANRDTGKGSGYIGITGNIDLLRQLWETVASAVSSGLATASSLGEK
ncbi:MAG: hypothetical protein ACOYWZ_08805 [Bacillota bacterium]